MALKQAGMGMRDKNENDVSEAFGDKPKADANRNFRIAYALACASLPMKH